MRIYRIINKINNKIYVGQTKRSLSERLTQHANNQESVSAVTAAIKKYGKENFIIEELAKADTQDQLDVLENTYIALFDSLAPNGYNLKSGGLEGSRYSEQSREKMAKAKIGTKVSDETKKKMSASHIERLKDPELRRMRGERFTQRVKKDSALREKFSKIRTQYWSSQENRDKASVRAKESMTDELKQNISQKVKEALSKSETREKLMASSVRHQKSVKRSDGIIFSSIKEAAIASNTRESSIIKNIKGQYKTAGGFTFEYFTPILPTKLTKPTVYLLIGAPAAGKSWVANQLLDKFNYISYDSNQKKLHLDMLRAPSTKLKLYDPTFKISTIIRRHSDEFDFKIVCIQEDEATLKNRMISRGGEWTSTVMKRNEQVKQRYAKYGTEGSFIGTSQECLDFLKNL